MRDYIVCEKRGNLPRIHVKICQLRCKEADTCEAYQDHLKSNAPDEILAKATVTELSAEQGLSAQGL